MLIALFVSYYASSAFFIHTHVIDGKTVTHSHPYLPSGHHTHSNAAFYLIQYLNQIVLVGGLLTVFMAALSFIRIILNSTAPHYLNRRFIRFSFLRGPPFC